MSDPVEVIAKVLIGDPRTGTVWGEAQEHERAQRVLDALAEAGYELVPSWEAIE